MFLVVNFEDLGLDYTETDVRIDDSADFSVGKLYNLICDGIENLTSSSISDRSLFELRDSNHKSFSTLSKVNELSLSDWDVIYVSRR